MIAQFTFHRLQFVDVIRADGRVVQQRSNLSQFPFHHVELFGVCAGRTDLLNLISLVDGVFRLLPQRVQNQIPIVEAFTARRTVWRIAQVAAIALVAFVAAHSWQAFALAGRSIALIRLRTVWIALASMTLLIRITPEVCLTLVALAPTETGAAPTLSIVRIALVVLGADTVTIARFASFAAGNFPMIRNA